MQIIFFIIKVFQPVLKKIMISKLCLQLMDNKWHSSFAFIYIKKRNHNIEFPMERDTYKTPKLESSLNKITVFLLVNAG